MGAVVHGVAGLPSSPFRGLPFRGNLLRPTTLGGPNPSASGFSRAASPRSWRRCRADETSAEPPTRRPRRAGREGEGEPTRWKAGCRGGAPLASPIETRELRSISNSPVFEECVEHLAQDQPSLVEAALYREDRVARDVGDLFVAQPRHVPEQENLAMALG